MVRCLNRQMTTSLTVVSLKMVETGPKYLECLQSSKRKPEYWSNLGSSKSRTKAQDQESREVVESLIDGIKQNQGRGSVDRELVQAPPSPLPPPPSNFIAVPRQLFCFGSLVILDVARWLYYPLAQQSCGGDVCPVRMYVRSFVRMFTFCHRSSDLIYYPISI